MPAARHSHRQLGGRQTRQTDGQTKPSIPRTIVCNLLCSFRFRFTTATTGHPTYVVHFSRRHSQIKLCSRRRAFIVHDYENEMAGGDSRSRGGRRQLQRFHQHHEPCSERDPCPFIVTPSSILQSRSSDEIEAHLRKSA